MSVPRMPAAVARQITAGIRAGAFPEVAAQAFGIAPESFTAWMRKAERGSRPFRVAHAQARLRAEVAVYEKQPKVWLEHGPGRERADHPGWTGPVRAGLHAPQGRNALLDAEFQARLEIVSDLFADQPDIRRQIADAFAGEPVLRRAA